MSNLPIEVFAMLGQAIAQVVPVTIVLALVFTVLTHFWACNPGKPWWRKRELVTDLCYWFFVPLFARVFRIGLLVLAAGFFFGLHGGREEQCLPPDREFRDDFADVVDEAHGPDEEGTE